MVGFEDPNEGEFYELADSRQGCRTADHYSYRQDPARHAVLHEADARVRIPDRAEALSAGEDRRRSIRRPQVNTATHCDGRRRLSIAPRYGRFPYSRNAAAHYP